MAEEPAKKVSCARCKYQKTRRVTLVSNSGNGSSASMIETANEEMRMDQLARKQEEERRLAEEEFEFEPRFLPWCQRFTIAKLSTKNLADFAEQGFIPKEWTQDLPDGASPLLKWILNKILDENEDPDELRRQFLNWQFDFAFDAPRGQVRPVYALCDRLNRMADCKYFSPR